MKIDVANIQIEQKSSITPFVAGSRAQNSTLYDLAGNNNHGTLINGPTYTDTTYGTIVFDGIDDYINIPSFTNQPSTGITCEAWIKPTKASVGTGTQRGGVISATSNMYLGIIDSTDGGTSFSLHWANNTNNGSQRPASWNGQIPNNAWTHIAGTWDGSTSIAYINGNEVWRSAQTGTIPSSTYVIGTYGGALTDGVHNFKGEIALARVYNRALSQPELMQNWMTGTTRFAL
jgi:hypothetical protein